jgi:hypothetical protein
MLSYAHHREIGEEGKTKWDKADDVDSNILSVTRRRAKVAPG